MSGYTWSLLILAFCLGVLFGEVGERLRRREPMDKQYIIHSIRAIGIVFMASSVSMPYHYVFARVGAIFGLICWGIAAVLSWSDRRRSATPSKTGKTNPAG
ncbi:MAG: hypothetical protein JO250_11030 [Armatimonadetes bacterium]|nr:hypothetical protein [Armatimonadota bacterium]